VGTISATKYISNNSAAQIGSDTKIFIGNTVTDVDFYENAFSAVLLGGASKLGAAKTGANLSTNGANLSRHLGQLEKYGQGGFKELQNGRFRYYGNVTPASTPGEMIGRRVVREWNPTNSGTRTWMETLDGAGTIRIVRPETGGTKVHFMFDKSLNFIKKW